MLILPENLPEGKIKSSPAVLVHTAAEEDGAKRCFENRPAREALAIVSVADLLKGASASVPSPDIGLSAQERWKYLRVVQKSSPRLDVIARTELLVAVTAKTERPA